MTWFEAKDYCESLDAYLAEVLDNEIQTFLESHAKTLSPTNWWVGAIDQVSTLLEPGMAMDFFLIRAHLNFFH